MRLSTLLIFPLAFIVNACTQGVPVKQPPITVSLKNNTAADRVVGYTKPVIRTFVPTETSQELQNQYESNPNSRPGGVQRTEITGATCTIDTAEFSAQFQTPAIVHLPKFHGKPSQLRMTCKTPELSTRYTHDPTLDGVVVVETSVAGLIAAAVMTGILASKDNWSYSTGESNVWIDLAEK
jgi:hypothetical protein